MNTEDTAIFCEDPPDSGLRRLPSHDVVSAVVVAAFAAALTCASSATYATAETTYFVNRDSRGPRAEVASNPRGPPICAPTC